MTRNISFGLILMLIVSGFSGCQEKPKGQPAAGPTDPDSAKQTQMPWRVNNWVERMTNGPDGEPGKRQSAAAQAAKHANDPKMTPELKAQLVAAAKKMVETEPMSNAEEKDKQAVIAEGNKALEALGAGGGEAPKEAPKAVPQEAPKEAGKEAPKEGEEK